MAERLREWHRDGRWEPWWALRARPHIRFRLSSELPEGVWGACQWQGARVAVLVAAHLGRQWRRVILGHELVHAEWGVPCRLGSPPELWGPVPARHEKRVDDEVARRLVPAAQLGRLIDQRLQFESRVTALEVGERFDVPVELAERALRLFKAGDLATAAAGGVELAG